MVPGGSERKRLTHRTAITIARSCALAAVMGEANSKRPAISSPICIRAVLSCDQKEFVSSVSWRLKSASPTAAALLAPVTGPGERVPRDGMVRALPEMR